MAHAVGRTVVMGYYISLPPLIALTDIGMVGTRCCDPMLLIVTDADSTMKVGSCRNPVLLIIASAAAEPRMLLLITSAVSSTVPTVHGNTLMPGLAYAGCGMVNAHSCKPLLSLLGPWLLETDGSSGAIFFLDPISLVIAYLVTPWSWRAVATHCCSLLQELLAAWSSRAVANYSCFFWPAICSLFELVLHQGCGAALAIGVCDVRRATPPIVSQHRQLSGSFQYANAPRFVLPPRSILPRAASCGDGARTTTRAEETLRFRLDEPIRKLDT